MNTMTQQVKKFLQTTQVGVCIRSERTRHLLEEVATDIPWLAIKACKACMSSGRRDLVLYLSALIEALPQGLLATATPVAKTEISDSTHRLQVHHPVAYRLTDLLALHDHYAHSASAQARVKMEEIERSLEALKRQLSLLSHPDLNFVWHEATIRAHLVHGQPRLKPTLH